jgi:CheY-like chemotaxis protein
MTRSLRGAAHLLLGIGVLAVALGTVHAQGDPKKDKKDRPLLQPGDEYRQYFKQPTTMPDLWAALQFEREVGRYELAALHLHSLIVMKDKALPGEKPEDFDQRKLTYETDLVKLHDQVGMEPLLRLRQLPEWKRVAQLPEFKKDTIDPVKESDELVNRVIAAVKAQRENPVRIKMLAQSLLKTPPEHDYALQELMIAKAAAIPSLIPELRRDQKADERHLLVDALVRLSPETLPPLVAALDSDDAGLQADIIEVLRRRGALEATPFLWYLAAGPDVAASVQRKARETLSAFLGKPISALPNPRTMLTDEAERYYRHEVTFPTPRAVVIWHWDPKVGTVVAGWPDAPTVSATRAELYYGLYFARRALAIDPTYEPAQVVLLSLSLEKAAEEQKDLTQTPPRLRELLSTVRPDLVLAVLERALDDKRPLVILGAVRALGELGEIKATRAPSGKVPALVRALRYPDPRVRFAAAVALTRIPQPPNLPAEVDPSGAVRPITAIAAGEVVDVLRRAVAAEPSGGKTRVMIGYSDNQLAGDVATRLERFGFAVVRVDTGRAVLRRLRDAADINILMLDIDLPDPGFPYLLSQIRAMPQGKNLPVVLTIDIRPADLPRALEDQLRSAHEASRNAELNLELLFPALQKAEVGRLKNDRERAEKALSTVAKLRPNDDLKNRTDILRTALQREDALLDIRADRQRAAAKNREDSLRRFLEHDVFASLYPVALTLNQEGLRDVLRSGTEEGKLTEAEQKAYANEAVKLLGRMAKGELPGYDVRPVEKDVLAALRENRLSEEADMGALAVVSRMGTPEAQSALAEVVLKPAFPPRIRLEAAEELVRHLQRYHVLLNAEQVQTLLKAFALEKEPALRARMGLVVGVLSPDPRRTGDLLRDFDPTRPVPPPPALEKLKDEKP